MHKRVFQKAEIARAASASAISAFWKIHKCKLIPNWTRKTVWLLINNTNMKKFVWKKCRKMFLEALFFAFEKIFFRVSVQNFGHCRLHEIVGLQLSQFLSSNHNPELRCVICTGVTLFAPVLHFLHWCYTWTALLSANQNRVIFSCVLLWMKTRSICLRELCCLYNLEFFSGIDKKNLRDTLLRLSLSWALLGKL